MNPWKPHSSAKKDFLLVYSYTGTSWQCFKRASVPENLAESNMHSFMGASYEELHKSSHPAGPTGTFLEGRPICTWGRSCVQRSAFLLWLMITKFSLWAQSSQTGMCLDTWMSCTDPLLHDNLAIIDFFPCCFLKQFPSRWFSATWFLDPREQQWTMFQRKTGVHAWSGGFGDA